MPLSAAAPESPADYVPGKQSVPGRQAVRIAANENPLPPLPSVVAAMTAGLGHVNRYPEPHAATLRAALADYHGISADMIAVGPGAGPLTERAVLASCAGGRELVIAQPSFIAYPNHAAMAGGRAVRVPLDASLTHDLAAMARQIGPDTGAVIVCNPNNPTGTAVGSDRLRAFLDAVPPACQVLLDEAYVDFADPAVARGPQLASEFPNLLVIRTFSKAHGLAGLRAGYAVGQQATIEAFNRARNIFQLSSLAQAAALASLEARDELAERVEAIRAERDWVSQQLAGLGIQTTRSQANFVWLPMTPQASAALTAALEEQGVLVRDLGTGVRVTIGTRGENEQLLAALQSRGA